MNVMKTISDFVRAYDAEVKAALVRAEKAETALARATSDETVTRVLEALGAGYRQHLEDGTIEDGWEGKEKLSYDEARARVADALQRVAKGEEEK